MCHPRSVFVEPAIVSHISEKEREKKEKNINNND
jgi:hypothetical protein